MEYTIKASSKRPITVINPSKGINRVVVYKRVKIITMRLNHENYDAGIVWGLRYGIIRLNGDPHIVKARMQSNGSWSQWELI